MKKSIHAFIFSIPIIVLEMKTEAIKPAKGCCEAIITELWKIDYIEHQNILELTL